MVDLLKVSSKPFDAIFDYGLTENDVACAKVVSFKKDIIILLIYFGIIGSFEKIIN